LTSLFVGSVDQHFYYVSNLTPSIWYQVYPAGFLYMYGFLKWLTDGGNNVLACQYIFCGLYVFNAAIVLTIYTLLGRSMQSFIPKNSLQYYHTVWSWRVAMVITCLSKRIHSIFVLRLFNDGPCMILFYVSVLLFAKSYWRIGCALFSLAVSIKMNVLLFAPGLLLLLLQSSPGIMETIICLGICAALQIILGAPFLCTYPVSYIRKAFEFDRVFFHKWTVNWKVSMVCRNYNSSLPVTTHRTHFFAIAIQFLPEDIFTGKTISVFLLSLHLGALAIFAFKWIRSTRKEVGKAFFVGNDLNPVYVVYTLFISNFIGIAFARTLHYQFYSWYFHSFPVLLWLTRLPIPLKLTLVAMVEYAFNVFPATHFSSAVLQIAHMLTLVALWSADVPQVCRRQHRIKEQ